MPFKILRATKVKTREKITDLLFEDFTIEDVEHLDEAICQIRARERGLLSLPGLEWVRNKVAAQAGVELKDEGTIQYEH